jgi:hypothetical protein
LNKGQFTHICQLNVSCGQDSVSGIVHVCIYKGINYIGLLLRNYEILIIGICIFYSKFVTNDLSFISNNKQTKSIIQLLHQEKLHQIIISPILILRKFLSFFLSGIIISSNNAL